MDLGVDKNHAEDVGSPLMGITVKSTVMLQGGLDSRLQEIAEQAQKVGQPIKIRVPLQLYRPQGNAYTGWNDSLWTVEAPGVVEAEAVRQAMVAFFGALATGRLEALTDGLKEFAEEGR